MKVVFAGTPEFARLAYAAIVDAGFEVPLVMTQPDRPAGRGMKLTPSAVKQEALERGAEVLQPISLRLDGKYPEDATAARAALEALQPDVMIVAAYGLFMPVYCRVGVVRHQFNARLRRVTSIAALVLCRWKPVLIRVLFYWRKS